MEIFLGIIDVILLAVVVLMNWNKLDSFEKPKRIILILVGTLICFAYTKIIYEISSKGIIYNIAEAKQKIGQMIILTFTQINGIIILPYMFGTINKIKYKELKKNEGNKRMIIIVLLIIVIAIIECKYFNNIQQGILDMMK